MFVAIKHRKTAAAAQSFLNALTRAAPFRIRTLLTDNGKEFTDRLFGKRVKEASGQLSSTRCVRLWALNTT